MINVTRGSNLQLIPLTDVLSPKNLGSPLNNFSQMLLLEHQNSLGSKQSSALREGAVFSPPTAQHQELLQQQQNRMQLQSQEQVFNGNLQFMKSFENNSNFEDKQYRDNGAASNLSQDLQSLGGPPILLHPPSGPIVYDNMKQYHFRNFSVSQTSSKESSGPINVLGTPSVQEHYIAAGSGGPNPQYSTIEQSVDQRRDSPKQMVVRTQHSSGEVNLQPIMMQIENLGGIGTSESSQRHPFSPPHVLYSQHSQNSSSGTRPPHPFDYMNINNPSINFVDNGLNDTQLLSNAAAIGPLSLRTQHSQQSQHQHHSIKTVASKQIPKCFRMSKQQLQQITNKVASRGSIHNGGTIPLVPEGYYSGNQSQTVQSSPQHHITLKQGGNSIVANDARVSFNDYSQFQSLKPSNPVGITSGTLVNNQQLSVLAAVKQHSPTKFQPTSQDSNIFQNGRRTSDIEQEQAVIEREEISERSVDEERERMTPAFNNRARADSIRNGNNPSQQQNYTPLAVAQTTMGSNFNNPKRVSPISPADMSAMMNHTLNNISAAITPPSLNHE